MPDLEKRGNNHPNSNNGVFMSMLDGAASSFQIKLYYRTEDTAAWTQAGSTADNTQRAAAENLAVEFYQLQVKVELDDDTGNNEDIAIEKIAVTYSADLG